MGLFNTKVIDRRLDRIFPIPQMHLDILEPWARSIADGSIYTQRETALHGDFKARILEDTLGYIRFGVAAEWTCSAEKPRATKQAWFELQQPQQAYIEDFEGPKIIYPEMSQGRKFSFHPGSLYINNKIFYIPGRSDDLLGYLNSALCWFFLRGESSPLRGGEWRLELREEYIRRIPIPAAVANGTADLGQYARQAMTAAKDRLHCQRQFRRRISDLCPDGGVPKLNGRLRDWWLLSSFAEFLKAIRTHYKVDLPPKVANDWDDFFREQRAAVQRLTSDVEAAEMEINKRVYSLFDLTKDEIDLVESNI